MTSKESTDSTTTVQQLKTLVAGFRDERNWRKYDSPRNLATSISVEAAELLEHFQWKTDEEVNKVLGDKERMEGVSDELADVIIYCAGLADVLKINISTALQRKLEKNARKYPPVRVPAAIQALGE